MEVITSHTNSDFDTIASMVAAKKLYPEAHIVFPGSLEKSLREALSGLDLPFEIENIKKIDLEKITRLILVDVRSGARIGPFSELTGKDGVDIHIYDHHPETKDSIRGSVEVIGECGSTSTILTLIIKERSLELSPSEATILMTGIYEDTGSLGYRSTTTSDYLAAAFLLESGADLVRVSELISNEMTPKGIDTLNEFLKSETRYTVGGVDVVIAAASVEGYKDDVSILAQRLTEINSPGALFMLADAGDRIHLVARSVLDEVNAGLVAMELGGGGHPSAASATLKGFSSLIEAKEALVRAIKKCVIPKTVAKDLMSSPPITVKPHTSIEEAGQKILRFNINALPVAEDGIMLGILTRQTASKALYHKLSECSVSEYMTTEYETVLPDTSIDDIRIKVFSHGQRLLPVVDAGGMIKGVITRTDLLKLLQDELVEEPGRGSVGRRTRSLKNLMNERLPGWVIKLLTDAGETAEELGFRAYAVGGFVRDLLMRRDNLDIDIVIEGDGIVFATEFARRQGFHIRSHERFRTAVLKTADGFQVDVATARLEYYEEPGALPTIELSSLKLDLYRRDFTINTLALDITPPKFAALIDFFGAQRDIKEKTVRAIHNLSFVEDPTRILRAVRFSERFGFGIAKQTLSLIKSTLKLDCYRQLSGARLRDELRNILKEDIAAPALTRLSELGVLGLIDPQIRWDARMESLFERARDTLAWYRLLYRREPVEVWLVLFLALTDQVDDISLMALAARLNIDGRRTREVLGARCKGVGALNRLRRDGSLRASEKYQLINPLPLEVTLYLMERSEDEAIKKLLSDYIRVERGAVKTLLSGADLMEIGVREGPDVGRLLDKLLAKRLDGEIETREDEEVFIKASLKSS